MLPSDDIVLRSYVRSDLHAMFRLDEICFEEPFRFSKADMRRFAEARKAQVLIAEREGALAGFSIVHVERGAGERVGYLLTLDVAPAFRRCGVAALLMAHAERSAYAADCSAMLLHVFTENAAAIALYEKLDYMRLGRADDFYCAGRHAWVYRKSFA